jgi:integrase|tara:strand:- start:247 stop:1581 length:1335 start_codon:yes stop_codon:yes gene_type:complete
MDLKVYPKRKTFVVQDMDDGRKQHGPAYKSKSAANAALKKLVADVATKRVVVGDRYKFKDEFKRYADERLKSAEDPTVALSKASIRSYESFYRNYIADCFPDFVEIKNAQGVVIKKVSCVYLDEITGKALYKFVTNCYEQKEATWKTVKKMISHIKTFLRDCDGNDMVVNHSVFNWKISKKTELHPDKHELKHPKKSTPIMPDEAEKLINSLYADRNKDFYAAYKLAAVATFTFTGLRFSELKGILKKYIDLENRTIFIAGVYDHNEGRYRERTKREESRRHIDIQDGFMPYLTEWLDKIKDMKSDYLFPSLRDTGPMSQHKFRTLIWKTFEEHGLAKLKWRTKKYNSKFSRGTSNTFKVISSPFKGCPTKAFRHAFGTHLVNSVKSDPNIDQNYARVALGHADYRTTELVYGTHIMRVSKEDRIARRAAVTKALNLKGLKLIK